MRIPCPNAQLSHVEVEGMLANGQKYKIVAGGGRFVDVPDDTVEALLRSYNKQGQTAQSAWTKEDGVQTVKLFMQNRELKKKIAAYEDKQKRSAKEKKREDVPVAKEPSKSESED